MSGNEILRHVIIAVGLAILSGIAAALALWELRNIALFPALWLGLVSAWASLRCWYRVKTLFKK